MILPLQSGNQIEYSKRHDSHDEDDSESIGQKEWTYIALITLVSIAYYWQKFIFTYAYGFHGLGDEAGNPMYEITQNYPLLIRDYKYLGGVTVLLPNVLFELFIGKLSDNVNRVLLIGIACIVYSGSTFIAGAVDNYQVFVAMRILLGLFSVAAFTPCVSLIRDYFPPNLRSRAVAIFLSSDFIGCSISALTILAIEKYGWRLDYEAVGAFGVVAGLAMLFFCEVPERGKFERLAAEKALKSALPAET